jgi:hypothetical protein
LLAATGRPVPVVLDAAAGRRGTAPYASPENAAVEAPDRGGRLPQLPLRPAATPAAAQPFLPSAAGAEACPEQGRRARHHAAKAAADDLVQSVFFTSLIIQ